MVQKLLQNYLSSENKSLRFCRAGSKKLSLFSFLCLLMLLFLLPLHAQTTADEEVTPPPSLSLVEEKKFSTEFVNDSEFLFYFRHSQVIEITGNESTFTAAFRLDIDYSIYLRRIASFRLTLDLHLMQPLSLKARFYENFSPPTFLYNELMLNIGFIDIFDLGFGLFKPLYRVLPMRSYFLPIAFKVSPLSAKDVNDNSKRQVGHSFITGNRDLPLSYIALNAFDTGFFIGINYKLLETIVALSNGEEGLDPNSAKTVSFRLALKNIFFHSGFSLQVGNIGSVPIKEMKHAYQYFFYYANDKHAKVDVKVGFETFLYLHGIRDLGILNIQNGAFRSGMTDKVTGVYGPIDIEQLKEHLSYVDGYFSPFSVFNNGSYDDSAQLNPNTLYGLSFLVYLELVFIDMINLNMHFSGYDPNILSENNAMYKIRYRGFLRLGVDPVEFMSIVFSFTYTYDQLFLHWSQFYDSEYRSWHHIEDYDIFVGLVFRFP